MEAVLWTPNSGLRTRDQLRAMPSILKLQFYTVNPLSKAIAALNPKLNP